MERKTSVSDSELEILEVLWEAGRPLNAGEIRSALNVHKDWERTTVLTLIQRLLKKGAISQEKREVYYYAPLIARRDHVQEETKNFVQRFFNGNIRNMVAALVDSDSLTKEDIEELRAYFDRTH